MTAARITTLRFTGQFGRAWPVFVALALGGCVASTPKTDPDGFLTETPDWVLEVAAPGQNLSTIKVNPEDGCYWYLHQGPVEATLLPLRSRDGRLICTAESPRAQGAVLPSPR
ncbi:hypothetical protein LV82_01669 [Albidovulum inexpectatum]|uniref:Lipoprotein n=1 Tax=Albidovulum inexpectatum TaxID=196587 RepID=A0A2S5JHE2_9RHOB|nr:hypothetical protein [Albidovulum inexpectatum]PPB80936.1 hypothetical protein LV82_01669 [Albidovulum inexpectatum]